MTKLEWYDFFLRALTKKDNIDRLKSHTDNYWIATDLAEEVDKAGFADAE